jgi:histidinol-phosphate aminotransferase
MRDNRNRTSRFEALEIARASYRDISLYAPDRSPCAIDLSDNTNLFGVPPAALAVLREAGEAAITRYPTLYAGGLKAALADYCDTDPSAIVTGCGSDDVLDSAMRAVSEPGDAIAFPEPSFAMVPIFARMNALQPIGVPLRPDYDIDADALLATGARIIYVCSPNNPTGTAASAAAVRQILDEARGLVIIDEAYAEFHDESYIADARRHDRLLVVRTMSKAFGLAGLRIGYAVGAPALIAEVEKSRGPYKVNALAERAALAAVRDDRAWVEAHIAETIRNRTRFADELRGLGLAPLPSSANFLLVPVPAAAKVGTAMRRAGVAVRPMPDLPVVGDALRISIGPWSMMEAALAALREGLACA